MKKKVFGVRKWPLKKTCFAILWIKRSHWRSIFYTFSFLLPHPKWDGTDPRTNGLEHSLTRYLHTASSSDRSWPEWIFFPRTGSKRGRRITLRFIALGRFYIQVFLPGIDTLIGKNLLLPVLDQKRLCGLRLFKYGRGDFTFGSPEGKKRYSSSSKQTVIENERETSSSPQR